jgi:hypothetical protein
LEADSVLRIFRELGQRCGLHVWCHPLWHTNITQAAELEQKAGLGLDKSRAHSRHKKIATLISTSTNTIARRRSRRRPP